MFSVISLERGDSYNRVIDHTPMLELKDITFSIREAGRQRVLRTHHKNVHAFVVGVISELTEAERLGCTREVNYYPYLYSTFVDIEANPVYSAKAALLINKKVLVYA